MNLYLRKAGDEFHKFDQPFTQYADAVKLGQDLVGYGNFYIDTGTRSPSREEQLLIIKPTKKSKLDDL